MQIKIFYTNVYLCNIIVAKDGTLRALTDRSIRIELYIPDNDAFIITYRDEVVTIPY